MRHSEFLSQRVFIICRRLGRLRGHNRDATPLENGCWKSRDGCIAEVFGVERVHGAHIGRVRAARTRAAAKGARDDARAGAGVRASAVVCTLPCGRYDLCAGGAMG